MLLFFGPGSGSGITTGRGTSGFAVVVIAGGTCGEETVLLAGRLARVEGNWAGFDLTLETTEAFDLWAWRRAWLYEPRAPSSSRPGAEALLCASLSTSRRWP